MAVTSTASAEPRRIATVDAGAPFLNALHAAIDPWGAVLQPVRVGQAGVALALPIDLARVVAQDARSNDVVWVSSVDSTYAVHVYDAETDQGSERELRLGAPVDAPSALAAAHAVVQMLRLTAAPLAAPPAPERAEDAANGVPAWAFGLTASAATHFEINGPQVEARTGLYASYWPDFLGRRLGVTLGASIGSGVPLLQPTAPLFVNGTLTDVGLRGALSAQLPLASWAILQPSLGGGDHLLNFDVSVPPSAQTPRLTHHASPAFDLQLALDVALPGDFARVGPWVGATYLALVHQIFVNDQVIAVDSRYTIEGGVCMEVVLH